MGFEDDSSELHFDNAWFSFATSDELNAQLCDAGFDQLDFEFVSLDLRVVGLGQDLLELLLCLSCEIG